MSAAPASDDLVTIREASIILHRAVFTIRQWERRGFAPTGQKVVAIRDGVTKQRYFRRADIDRLHAALFPGA